MQFTLITFAALLAVAFAVPTAYPAGAEDIVARAPQVAAETAAMTDANGNVVAFDPAGVVVSGV
ncbi:hypothetical protein BP6252_05351 [Coleophoma cylindrospora]|uniref:Uncharacterized protein n=1 Tax=Coleophoma cylindrospora TaxID=1849047 RepID=A0A3D8RTL0_9HELO|nr:hypothetical protein BP6252_05351 [Coleophoma cylindrospora]